MQSTKYFLDLAARVATRAAGYVEPNPLVGAVITQRIERPEGGGFDEQVIGIGHHRFWGGPHAEVDALANADLRRHDVRGGTLYVTLEPCAHHGKQPPCVEAILSSGVGRVVIARRDPNAQASGGEERLRAAGIDVEFSDASTAARDLSDPFVKRVTMGLPWTIVKWAQTMDGRVATRIGDSKWISCEQSRRRVHRLRARVDAVVTAVGTLMADDPVLTARAGWRRRRVARRVVLDPGLEISDTCMLLRTLDEAPLTLFVSDDALRTQQRKTALLTAQGVEIVAMGTEDELRVDDVLRHLVSVHQATNVLIEAGPGLVGRLFESDAVDEAHVYIAPMLIGDEQAKPCARGRVVERLGDARRYALKRVRRVCDDVELVYRRVPNPRPM